MAQNVVCCETAIRLKLGCKADEPVARPNVADDPSETWARPPSAQPELVHCPLLMCQF
jgi:hypothetical protein